MATLYFLSGECLATGVDGNNLIEGFRGRGGASGERKTCELLLEFLLKKAKIFEVS